MIVRYFTILMLFVLTFAFAMPPRFSGNAYHTCIVGKPLDKPKDLSRGSIETCVILIQFTDNRADTIDHTPARYDSMFYSTNVYYGQYRQGSLNDFFKENSYNLTDVRGGITGNRWWMSNRTYSYYYDGNYMLSTGYQLARDAVQVADATVDFHQYDYDNDNHIDGVFVVHAGPGGEDTGNVNHCWSHAIPSFNYTTNDGIIIDGATNVPEINLVTPSLDTTLCCIAVMCHELGHVVGLPDLYDGSRNTWGVGYWSLMGYGAWGAGGNTPWSPSHCDAWSKKRVNWLNYTAITSNIFGLRVLDLETHPVAYRVWRNGVINDTFFILENRQNIGFDTPLPGVGLLIWHIDPRYGVYHNIVDLEEADGCDDLDHGWGYRPDPHYYHHELGDSGDPYPGDSNNVLFDRFSYPSSNSNYGSPTNVTVRNIHIVGDTVICDVLINTVDVSEIKTESFPNLLTVTPNPAKGTVYINFNSTPGIKNIISLYDASGRMMKKLFEGEIKGIRHIQWRPENLSAGIYFLKLENSNCSRIEKFIYINK